MSEQELSNLRGVEDRLIADVASHVAAEIFCLVVPTDGAHMCICIFANKFLNFVQRVQYVRGDNEEDVQH